ncbi:MAG: hypothetical protein ACI8RZ_006029 [Myxococcota bacterium]|jgi:hypothetical protein
MNLPDALAQMIGQQQQIDRIPEVLRSFARTSRAPVVGAYHITCSDESEQECIMAFDREFVRPLLPELKYWRQSAFRTANLGARYETGALAIAEEHYATPDSANDHKLLVIKLNSHVSLVHAEDGVHYGRMQRYDRECVYCGALTALLAGSDAGFARALRHTIGDVRLAVLRAADPDTRALSAAIVNARLQGERVLAAIRAHTPHTPTRYLIAAGVTLNRQQHDDAELPVAFWSVDLDGTISLAGLSSDPTRYRTGADRVGRLVVTEV